MFQHDFVDALAVADEVVLAPLYAPEKVPAGQRLDVERLAADLRSLEIPARVVAGAEATADHLSKRAGPGDTVVIMSSGDYGGLHDLLLARLGDPVRPARPADKTQIGQLLDRAGITHGGLDKMWSEFLVIPAPDSNEIAACVAIEHVEDDALLRMLAVSPGAARRGSRLLARRCRHEEGAHGRRPSPLPGHRRRPGLPRREARVSTSSIRRASPRRSPPPIEYQMARSKTAMWMRKEL